MKNLNITDVTCSLICGYFWVEFDNGRSIQCCLMKRKDGDGFEKAINFDDPGIAWGICADVNAWAAPDDDYEFVYTTIKREARKAGVRIINP